MSTQFDCYAMPAEPDRRLYCKTGFGLKSKPLGEEDNAHDDRPFAGGRGALVNGPRRSCG